MEIESKVAVVSFSEATADCDLNQHTKRNGAEWFKKYFLEGRAYLFTLNLFHILGQKLEGLAVAEALSIPADASFDQKLLIKYRKFIAFLIPFFIAQVNLEFFYVCSHA